jgi:dihydrofolate reductase
MPEVRSEISMSLDGFVAGPNPRPEEPLGDGGERLHEWVFKLAAWREPHGRSGGETGPVNDMLADSIERNGAEIMGRGMFGGGPGPWPEDPPWNGWWGGEPPFGHPVFVLTHHEREPLTLGATTFHFVTDGIESALDQARAAAGELDVHIGGGGETIQQYVAAGLVDELTIHLVPILLGGGARLFDSPEQAMRTLEISRVLDSPDATHVAYRITGAPRESG